MYVLHTVLTIVSGELFYQTYLPMVSPIGSEAVRSRLPFPSAHRERPRFLCPAVHVLSCGSCCNQKPSLRNCFKLQRCFLYVWIWMRWKRPA